MDRHALRMKGKKIPDKERRILEALRIQREGAGAEFPKLLYRKSPTGKTRLQDGRYDMVQVEGESDQAIALAEGFKALSKDDPTNKVPAVPAKAPSPAVAEKKVGK